MLFWATEETSYVNIGLSYKHQPKDWRFPPPPKGKYLNTVIQGLKNVFISQFHLNNQKMSYLIQ